jgi:hypothetical protein
MTVAMAVYAPTPQHHLVLEIQVSSSSPAHPNLFYVSSLLNQNKLFLWRLQLSLEIHHLLEPLGNSIKVLL